MPSRGGHGRNEQAPYFQQAFSGWTPSQPPSATGRGGRGGRGRGGRGGAATAGQQPRGRGRGHPLVNMTNMSLDYEVPSLQLPTSAAPLADVQIDVPSSSSTTATAIASMPVSVDSAGTQNATTGRAFRAYDSTQAAENESSLSSRSVGLNGGPRRASGAQTPTTFQSPGFQQQQQQSYQIKQRGPSSTHTSISKSSSSYPASARQSNNSSPFQYPHGRSSYPQALHLGIGASRPVTLNSAQGSSHQSNYANKPNGAHYASFPGGPALGRFRRAENIPHDPNLLRPVLFVRASQQISSTMDKEEEERLLAQKRLDQLFATGKSPDTDDKMAWNDPSSSTDALGLGNGRMSRSPSHESASPSSRRIENPLKQVLAQDDPTSVAGGSPKPQFGFLGKHAPIFSPPHQRPAQLEPSHQQPPITNSSVSAHGTSVEPVDLPDATFVVDVVGDREIAANQVGVSASMPSKTASSQADQDSELESDTEEIYPKHIPPVHREPVLAERVNSSTDIAHASLLDSTATTRPYARIVEDGVVPGSMAQPAVISLSDEAKAILELESESSPEKSGPFVSRKTRKKQQKQAAKERKKDRKKGRTAGLQRDRQHRKVPRMDDSDVEWGSDGPPVAQTQRDDFDGAEEEMASLVISEVAVQRVGGEVKSKHGSSQGGRPHGRNSRKIEADLAMQDYLDNIARQEARDGSETGSEDDHANGNDLAQLQSFVRSLTGGGAREHLTIEDLADIAQIRAEEFESDASGGSDGSGSESSEGDKALGDGEDAWESDSEIGQADIFRSSSDENDDDDDMNADVWTKEGKEYLAKTASKDLGTVESEEDEHDEVDGESDNTAAKRKERVSSTGGDGKDVKYIVESDSSDEEEDEDAISDAIAEDEEEMLGEMLRAQTRKERKLRAQVPAFETDDFDDYLQAQWLKDRQKKAIKKQERLLKRLEGKPTKANAKKAKRAANKARGWGADLDDGEDFGVNGDSDRADARVPEFHKINEDLRDFIENSGYAEYPLPPMDKKFRVAIHMLANAYNMQSKSRGQGNRRHNVLYRTMHTSVSNADNRKVQKYLSITSTWTSGKNKSYTWDAKAASSAAKRNGGGNVSRNYDGAVVGEGADKIASDNVGHRMLAKMGWSEGMQIGRTGGIHEPIRAIVKTSKAGLGSGWIKYNRGLINNGSGSGTGANTPDANLELSWGM